MGGQPHPWGLLHPQVGKRRRLGTKPRGRCGLSPATSRLFLGYLFCHARPPPTGARAFARPRFPACAPCVQGRSQPGFSPCSLRRSSDPPEPSFGHPRYLFRGVPPQPNRPPAAVPGVYPRVSGAAGGGQCSRGASPRPGDRGSLLLPTLCTPRRPATTGCGEGPQGLLAPSGVPGLCTWR